MNKEDYKSIIEVKCVSCGKIETIILTADEQMKLDDGVEISEALPTRNIFERELFISNFCFDCQERTFNRPTPEHEDEWGEQIGYCVCCDSSVYEKKNCVDDNEFICTVCGTCMVLNEETGDLEEIDD